MSVFERRRRNKFIDKSLEVTEDAMRLSGTRMRLGMFSGALASMQANLFVPNIRHGRVIIPKGIEDTDKVPIIALQPGEQIVLPAMMREVMPAQREALALRMSRLFGRRHEQPTAHDIDVFVEHCQKQDPERGQGFPMRPLGKGDSAATYAATGVLMMDETAYQGITTARGWSGRPIIALNIDPSGTRRSHAPASTMVHEEMHAYQFVDRIPYARASPTDAPVFELQANHAAAVTAGSQLEARGLTGVKRLGENEEADNLIGSAGFAAIAIDMQRLRYNRFARSPYEPVPELVGFLARVGAIDMDLPR